MKKVLLAYSGGLDTSIILKWLIQKKYEVSCFIADIGQNEDLDQISKRALKIGAKEVEIYDLKEEFVNNYIFEYLQTNAKYENRYLLGTALARPLIAKKMSEIANKKNIKAIAHGATGKGNDQVRFEIVLLQSIPNIEIISPWKDSEFLSTFKGRNDMLDYAAKNNIPINCTKKKPYSTDSNLMHTSYEGGNLEDPEFTPNENMYQKTVSPQKAPSDGLDITIEFKSGIPSIIKEHKSDLEIKSSLKIFEYLNKIGGRHGIGRIDIVESRFIGMKSRGVYEAPGTEILLTALKDLESIILDREVIYMKETMAPKIAQLIYNGFWFSPEMKFLMASIKETQNKINGKVNITLYKGNVIITGRSSPNSIYNKNIASMDTNEGYNQEDAKGFIKIQALRLMNFNE